MTGFLLPIKGTNGALNIFEVPPDQLYWPELQLIWDNSSIKLPFCFVPPESKLDVFFAFACRKSGRPISLGTVFNPGWSAYFLSEVGHDALVISFDLVKYINGNALFADHLSRFDQCVVVGDPGFETMEGLRSRLSTTDVRKLPHPEETLSEFRC